MTVFFSLKLGQDLENRAAHPYDEFPGIAPGLRLHGSRDLFSARGKAAQKEATFQGGERDS